MCISNYNRKTLWSTYLRFWYHVFTCVSERLSFAASSIRSCTERYFCRSKLFSRVCVEENKNKLNYILSAFSFYLNNRILDSSRTEVFTCNWWSVKAVRALRCFFCILSSGMIRPPPPTKRSPDPLLALLLLRPENEMKKTIDCEFILMTKLIFSIKEYNHNLSLIFLVQMLLNQLTHFWR